MIEQADRVPRDLRIGCDVCIIGGGAAGITLAAELDGSGLDVVLLESGGEVQEADTPRLYQGSLTGARQFPLHESRLRFLGGTTNHWAGWCRPIDSLNFEDRPWVPHSGWPIGRKDLDPYYVRAHEVCDLGPYDYGERSWPGVTDPGPLLHGQPDVVLKMVQHSKPTRWARKYRSLLSRPRWPPRSPSRECVRNRSRSDGADDQAR